MGNNIRSSSRPKALAPSIPMPPLADAMDAVHLSVEREALAEMPWRRTPRPCAGPDIGHGDRRGYRWGRTHSEIGYHGGKVKVARPRVRDRAGKEVSLESWQALRDGNLLLEWALNLMVLNCRPASTTARSVCPRATSKAVATTSKSAVSRRFVALSQEDEGLARLGSELDPRAVHPPDGGDRRRARRRWSRGRRTRSSLDRQSPRQGARSEPRLFIVDGAKAQQSDPKHLRCGRRHPALPGPLAVKGRNIIERLPQQHASVKKALRQAWDQDDAAERLLSGPALEHEEPGVRAASWRGWRRNPHRHPPRLPHELRRSLACTNIVRTSAR